MRANVFHGVDPEQVHAALTEFREGEGYRLEDAGAETRDNLLHPAPAAQRLDGQGEREGRLGEAEGLRVSLVAAEEKITQLDARQERRSSPVFL